MFPRSFYRSTLMNSSGTKIHPANSRRLFSTINKKDSHSILWEHPNKFFKTKKVLAKLRLQENTKLFEVIDNQLTDEQKPPIYHIQLENELRTIFQHFEDALQTTNIEQVITKLDTKYSYGNIEDIAKTSYTVLFIVKSLVMVPLRNRVYGMPMSFNIPQRALLHKDLGLKSNASYVSFSNLYLWVLKMVNMGADKEFVKLLNFEYECLNAIYTLKENNQLSAVDMQLLENVIFLFGSVLMEEDMSWKDEILRKNRLLRSLLVLKPALMPLEWDERIIKE